MSVPTPAWTPSSWRTKAQAQAVDYPDVTKLDEVCSRLRTLPGLVTPVEIERLKAQLADVADGKAFLLQSGDCAELFAECQPSLIDAKLKLSLLMSLIIIWGARLPVVRVGRIAGQYAKPRSKPTEMVEVEVKGEDGSVIKEKREVMSFRGDNVNSFSPDPTLRLPDPDRLLMAYFHSCATLNHIRAALASGIADLHAPRSWSFAHVRSATLLREFEGIVDSLSDALDFMKVVGADNSQRGAGSLESVDYWISHEALMLEYEEALTRQSAPKVPQSSPSPSTTTSSTSRHYDLSAHTIWLGDRTRQLDGAHLEFFSGLSNPIGIKVGPTMKPLELVSILEKVDPKVTKGRCTLICRFGAGKAPTLLPPLIEAVRSSKYSESVIWCCDPMHGNTRSSPLDPALKTRAFADIVTEVTESLQCHAQLGSRLGGVHLELTGEVDEAGESVTECVGGSMQLGEEDLRRRYKTHCDPRLNYEQSLDIAFLLSHSLRSRRLGRGALSRVGSREHLQSLGSAASLPAAAHAHADASAHANAKGDWPVGEAGTTAKEGESKVDGGGSSSGQGMGLGLGQGKETEEEMLRELVRGITSRGK